MSKTKVYQVLDTNGSNHLLSWPVENVAWACSCQQPYCYAVDSLLHSFVHNGSLVNEEQMYYDFQGNVFNSKGARLENVFVDAHGKLVDDDD